MKIVKLIIVILAVICIGLNQVNASESSTKVKKTAESVLAVASTFNELTPENANILKDEINSLSTGERLRLINMSIRQVNNAKLAGDISNAKPALYIVAIFLPPLAVGVYTDWGMPTIWNICWCCIFWVPGIIHAFYVLSR